MKFEIWKSSRSDRLDLILKSWALLQCCSKLVEEVELRKGENEQLGLRSDINSREGIYYHVRFATLILDMIIITNELCQVVLLFWGLYDLCHQVL